jgi:hypothetical protein
MKFIAKIPDWFSVRKAAQVTAYFAIRAGGVIKVLKATKMVYLGDRHSLDDRDVPITGDNLVSMPFGPVNTYTYSLMKGEVTPKHKAIWSEYISERGDSLDLRLARPIEFDDLDELSRADIRVLDKTWNLYKDIDRFALADWTHKYCPEWKDPLGSSYPITFEVLFKTLNKPKPAELIKQIDTERALVASFKD